MVFNDLTTTEKNISVNTCRVINFLHHHINPLIRHLRYNNKNMSQFNVKRRSLCIVIDGHLSHITHIRRTKDLQISSAHHNAMHIKKNFLNF